MVREDPAKAALYCPQHFLDGGGDGGTGNGSSSSSSSSSSTGGTLPTAPQNATVLIGDAGSGTVLVACDPVSGADAYNFYWDGILKATSALPSALLEGFTSGESVTVIIKAQNATGEGPGSEPVTAAAG